MDVLKRRIAGDTGFGLISTIMVMVVIFGLGLGALSFADGEQRQSGRERVGESSFNFSEGVLSSQAFLLTSDWPGTSQGAFASQCTQSTTSSRCPSSAELAKAFNEPDFAAAEQWSTEVRDDAPTGTGCVPADPQADPFYSDAVRNNLTWDANCNGEMWVRAQATVDGRTRAMVARVTIEEVPEQFPQQLVTAGKVATGNNGNKVIIDRNGLQDEWQNQPPGPGPVRVRCADVNSPACVDKGKDKQISPCCAEGGQSGRTYGSPGAVNRMRAKARASGSYYATCPSTLPSPANRIIFIESGNCSYTSNTQVFSPTAPGVLIIASGTIEISGTVNFYGIVYAANLQNSTAIDVIKIHGNAQVVGAAAVDGNGGILAGQSKANLVWDPRIFSDPVALTSYGTAGVLKNTFRELPTR